MKTRPDGGSGAASLARAQTERLQAAAARGRIIDAEAEQRRADREP
jgi:hypothetical protein